MSESNSLLKVGTRCVVVAGCPQNIGLLVQVVQHIGATRGYLDGYEIQTVTGRKFRQLWVGSKLRAGTSEFAFTERANLRPLVDPKSFESEEAESKELPAQLSESKARSEQRFSESADVTSQ